MKHPAADPAQPSSVTGQERRRLPRIGAILAGASALLCVATAFCYAARPDEAAAFTLFPAWAWTLGGMGLALPGWRHRPRWPVLVLCGWLLFLLSFAEEPWSVLRGAAHRAGGRRTEAGAIRVVSLNCAGGSLEAASEVAAVQPDIVLLQESPTREKVEALASELFGSVRHCVWRVDASILARGTLLPLPLPRNASQFTRGLARLPSELEMEVASLRLAPPVIRMDFWSAEARREHAENRRLRRAQLAEVLAGMEPKRDLPLILGGDFNAPAGDAVYRLLQPPLKDPFARAGIGWGNTAVNDLPIARIDQIWTSDHFRPLRVFARRTRYSDHRMVVCDLVPR